MLTVSPDGTIETWSAGAERLYGYTAREIVGQSVRRLLPLYELPQWGGLHATNGGNGGGGSRSIQVGERLHKNGSRILLAIRRSIIRGDNREAEGILEMAQALDPHKALWLPEETTVRLLMDQVPGLHWTTDRNLRILTHWGSALPAAKIRPGSLAGRDIRKFLEAADAHATPIAEHYAALRGAVSRCEYTWKGNMLEIRTGPLLSASGEISGCLGAAVDITDRKKSEEQALYQARHDGLTGLANYREFMDHLAGNRALRRLAAVMNEHCRSTDVAARYGGDEFAVLLIDSDRGMAEHVAQRIEQRLRSDQEKPQLSVSIGVGIYPDDGRTAAEIIDAADQRLYRRKKSSTQRSVSAP